ncbi:hypothetical protein [Bradyrhizobium sp. BRP23]|uniref:hypothetical protein n=1 Tax=Bradyrhizobium sp. BRP23 TaxID=2793820 RepID=UPI001CD35281|nr:hypothetical protein [Bradyrhizobium sp. BRP23]MCA1383672.1 hypothetical protein [Bradyrhizobium sp. BRP05]MCA1417911.1 hypothetical protein [Bradyrhizobium sp. BRP23]
MHMLSITADSIAVLAPAGAVLACLAMRLRRRSLTFFEGGALLAAGLLLAAALPMVSRLPWTGLVDEMTGQLVAAFHFLEVVYVVLTL